MPRRNRTGKKRKVSATFLKAGNQWRDHIKKTMKNNPSMKFGKSLLKLASKTYKKGLVQETAEPVATRSTGRSTGRRTGSTRPKKRTKRMKRSKSRGFLGF